MRAQVGAQPAPGQGAKAERRQRDQRGRRGEAAGTGQREPEEDDVAGHVGDEHVPQHQVAEGIHQTGHTVKPSSNGGRGRCGSSAAGTIAPDPRPTTAASRDPGLPDQVAESHPDKPVGRAASALICVEFR